MSLLISESSAYILFLGFDILLVHKDGNCNGDISGKLKKITPKFLELNCNASLSLRDVSRNQSGSKVSQRNPADLHAKLAAVGDAIRIAIKNHPCQFAASAETYSYEPLHATALCKSYARITEGYYTLFCYGAGKHRNKVVRSKFLDLFSRVGFMQVGLMTDENQSSSKQMKILTSSVLPLPCTYYERIYDKASRVQGYMTFSIFFFAIIEVCEYVVEDCELSKFLQVFLVQALASYEE